MRLVPLVAVAAMVVVAGCTTPLELAVDTVDPAAPVFSVTTDGAPVAAVNVLRVKRCQGACGPLDDTFWATPAGDDEWMWGVADEDRSREGSRGPKLAVPVTYGVRAATVGACSCAFDENRLPPVPLTEGTFVVGVQRVAGWTSGIAFATFDID